MPVSGIATIPDDPTWKVDEHLGPCSDLHVYGPKRGYRGDQLHIRLGDAATMESQIFGIRSKQGGKNRGSLGLNSWLSC
jgi:hypothetical protein